MCICLCACAFVYVSRYECVCVYANALSYLIENSLLHQTQTVY